MKLGVHLVNFGLPGGTAAIGGTLANIGRAAEDAGVANLSAMDHYLQIGGMGIGGVDAPMLEGYTTLGYLAAHTRTVQLQLLVTGVTYRHPGLLAKIVTTLDVLSGGRAMLGLGAAWYEREHAAYGVPFPPLKERFERLDEALGLHRLVLVRGDLFFKLGNLAFRGRDAAKARAHWEQTVRLNPGHQLARANLDLLPVTA